MMGNHELTIITLTKENHLSFSGPRNILSVRYGE